MTATASSLAVEAGLVWFDYQAQAIDAVAAQHGPSQRLCLYYKTGAGKTYTALACVRAAGHTQALVVAPPSTHLAWQAAGQRLGVVVDCMSHAKFRMKDTKLSRSEAVIADEFHMFGGHGGKGWKKLDGLARGLKAPLILASATPNYNDAERVYCVQHILDPHSVKGGYIQFLYANCITEENPFGREPYVLGFHKYKDAEEFLASLPNVAYLPDDLVYTIDDVMIPDTMPTLFDRFGYDERNHRVMASLMEERHVRVYQNLVDRRGLLHPHIHAHLKAFVARAKGPVLVYANHATVASAASATLLLDDVVCGLVTGKTSKSEKDLVISQFQKKTFPILVGTASLATGTDGLDKMCDHLFILDDTDDDALRRQLIGRIMPRGADTDASKKRVYRLVQ